jgi:hypothetical protein
MFKESMKNDKVYSTKLRINENNNPVEGFDVNKTYKYDQSLMIKAIKNGMIINMLYKGEKDTSSNGSERTFCPLVLGINKNTKNYLVRGFHLDGYSVGESRDVQKVWRLFNIDNIISMSFTGNFMRTSPKNYRMNDRVMSERTIQRADFNEIRRNQNRLIQSGVIEAEEEAQINTKLTIASINVEKSDVELDLKNPWKNNVLSDQQKNPSIVKVSILKSIMGDNYIAIIGAIGTLNRSVKVYDNNVLIGTFKCLDAFTGDQFNKHRMVRNKSQFPIYLFKGKK